MLEAEPLHKQAPGARERTIGKAYPDTKASNRMVFGRLINLARWLCRLAEDCRLSR